MLIFKKNSCKVINDNYSDLYFSSIFIFIMLLDIKKICF